VEGKGEGRYLRPQAVLIFIWCLPSCFNDWSCCLKHPGLVRGENGRPINWLTPFRGITEYSYAHLLINYMLLFLLYRYRDPELRIFRRYDVNERRLFGYRRQVHALYYFWHHPLSQLLLLHPSTVRTENAEIIPLIQRTLDHHRPTLHALPAPLYLFLSEYVLELLLDLRTVLPLGGPPENGFHVILAAPLKLLKSRFKCILTLGYLVWPS